MVLPSAPLPRFPGFGERQQSRPLLSYRESGPAQDEPSQPAAYGAYCRPSRSWYRVASEVEVPKSPVGKWRRDRQPRLKPHRKRHAGAVQNSCQPSRRSNGRRTNTRCVCACRARRDPRANHSYDRRSTPASETGRGSPCKLGVEKPTSKLKNGGLEEDSVFPHAPSFLRAGPPSHGGDTLPLLSQPDSLIYLCFDPGSHGSALCLSYPR